MLYIIDNLIDCNMSSKNVTSRYADLSARDATNEPFISGSTVIRMLFYTFLMVTVPISSYFISKKYLFENFLQWSEADSIVPSALTSVVMVHIVLGLFVYSAYAEDIPSKKKRD